VPSPLSVKVKYWLVAMVMVSASSMDVSVSVNVTVATVTPAPVLSGRFDVPAANVTPLYVGSAAGAHEHDVELLILSLWN